MPREPLLPYFAACCLLSYFLFLFLELVIVLVVVAIVVAVVVVLLQLFVGLVIVVAVVARVVVRLSLLVVGTVSYFLRLLLCLDVVGCRALLNFSILFCFQPAFPAF